MLFMPVRLSGAGSERFQFNHLTATDGLSHQQINGLAQDEEGYIWIGTRNGLGRYDGYRIRNYYHSSDPRSLRHNFVRKIFPDSKGRIWILTISGLCRYMPETDDFKYYGMDADFAAIAEGKDGSVLCGGEGLYVIREETDSLERLEFTEGYVISLACGRDGGFFASTNGGVFQCDAVGGVWRRMDEAMYGDFINGLDAIMPLFVDRRGLLWVGRNGQGVMTVNPVTGTSEIRLRTGTVRTIAEDGNYRIWLGTSEGIVVMDTDGTSKRICQEAHRSSSLSDNSIYSILPDRDGNIWVGTFFGGVNLYVPDRHPFSVPSPEHDEESLGGKVVRMMAETEEGTLWVATENGGLLLMNRKTGETRRFRGIPDLGSNIHSLYHAPGSCEMWIGTFRNGLFRYRLGNGDWKRYLPADGLGSDAVFHINADRKGTLWVATTQGLVYYDDMSDSFKNIGDATLDSNFTYVIFPDSSGDLWIGTTRYGLRRISGDTGIITPVNVDTSPFKLNDPFVTCICEDKSGNMLVGSNNSGVQVLNTGDGRDAVLSADFSTLANATICAIVPDVKGNLWISSAIGLYRRDAETGELARFTTADGLPSTQMNLSSWHVSDDGEIYFGTVNGLFSFRPEKILPAYPRIAPVRIIKVTANGKELYPRDSTGLFAGGMDGVKPINMPYSLSRTIDIEYGVIMPGTADRMRFQARLEGEGSEWRDMGSERRITLFNLSPGTYTLQLRASSASGGWDKAPVNRFTFVVSPPFYRSAAAYLVYIFVAIVIAVGAIRFYLIRTRERRALAEARLEKENEIKMNRAKSEFFSMMSHELKTPLTLIGAPLRNMARNKDLPSDVHADLNLAVTNAARMEEMVNNLLTFNKVQQGEFPFVIQQGDPTRVIRLIGAQFAAHALEHGLIFDMDCKDMPPGKQPEMWFSKAYLEHIIGNLLSNAIKFTPRGGRLRLCSCVGLESGDTPTLTVKVVDTGCGIAPEEIGKIFNYHYRGEVSDNGGWGIGLALVKVLVEKHGGNIGVESRLGEGSRFKVVLSLCRNDLCGATSCPDAKGCAYEPKGETSCGSGQTILIVEDNEEMLGFLTRVLGEHYKVLNASNGEVALNMARTQPVDLLLSDVMMPVMDGLELCRQIKEDFATSHIPVVLLTARGNGEKMIEGLEHGADAYMTKPFTPYGLELQIRNLLHSIKARNAATASDPENARERVDLTELDKNFLERLNELVTENIANSDFSVSDLTVALGVSRSLLYAKMRALTSMAPADYMRCKRLELGCTLLRNGHTVSETAYATGFTDPAHFSKMFKKRYGISPSDFGNSGLRHGNASCD